MPSGFGLVTRFVCTLCGRAYAPPEAPFTCPACGLEGILDIEYDYDAVRRLLTRDRLTGNPERSHPWGGPRSSMPPRWRGTTACTPST
ncbi:MAG: hypothetical protein QN141_13785 [Armatimonadota bacterium]|nr:hypothetical protein [Armatimonadota bacterium]